MIGVLAICVWLYLLGAAFVVMAWVMTLRLTPEHRRRQILRWLATWSAKGLGLPVAIWAVMNVGLSWQLQPFMPDVQAALNSGSGWFTAWLSAIAMGVFVIGSYWASGTLAWVLFSTSRGLGDEPRKDLRSLALTCAAGLGVPALLVFFLGGWPWLGFAAAIILAPMAGYSPSIIQPNQLPPMYARAIARIKFGKYAEAEWEIIRELEKSEDDFEGWMMLADLYATRFNDIAEAERTILEICDQPRINPSQLSVALHRLAEWHLKVASDPAAARRALQMIADRLPGTHLARMALLRIKQLPFTAEQWREQQNAPPIPLPALGAELDRPARDPEVVDQKQAGALANACVERLKKDPDDTAAREKLARLFTEQLERADLGLEQLRLLLNMPEQTDAKRAEWLSLSAAWELRYRRNPAGARRILERIVQEFPSSPQAFAARRRLESLPPEPPRLEQQPQQTDSPG